MILSTRVVPEDQHPGGSVPKRVFLVLGGGRGGGVEWWGKEGFGEQVLDRHFSRSQKLFLKIFLPNFSKTCNTKKKTKKKVPSFIYFHFLYFSFGGDGKHGIH